MTIRLGFDTTKELDFSTPWKVAYTPKNTPAALLLYYD